MTQTENAVLVSIADWDCPKCGGSGWRDCFTRTTWKDGQVVETREITSAEYVEHLGKLPGLYQQEVYTGVTTCDCARGQLLRAPRQPDPVPEKPPRKSAKKARAIYDGKLRASGE